MGVILSKRCPGSSSLKRRAIYISHKGVRYLNRPLLFAFAARKLGYSLHFSTYREIMTQTRLWPVVAGLDKIRFLKPAVWAIEGLVSGLICLQFDSVFLQNPMGALELRSERYDGTIILDYMDFLVEENGTLPLYHYLNLKVADGIIFWSKAVKEMVKPYFPKTPTLYLPFGVSLSLFNPVRSGEGEFLRAFPAAKNKLRLLYSGGIWRGPNSEDYQGVDKLPRLLRLLKNTNGEKFLLVLNAPYDGKLYRDFKLSATLSQVLWIPPTPSSSPLRQSMFRAADICILPASRYPPIYYAERMKMFEYMASGRAIVAEETAGVRGVLKDGYSALFSKLDDVDNLSGKVITLLEDRELREYLGKNAFRELTENYEWSVLAQKLASFLTSFPSFE